MVMDIKVNIQDQDNILECLSTVFDIVQAVKRTEDRSVMLDLSSIHTPSPVLTILLASTGGELTYVLSDVLKAAHLGNEIKADDMRLSAFKA